MINLVRVPNPKTTKATYRHVKLIGKSSSESRRIFLGLMNAVKVRTAIRRKLKKIANSDIEKARILKFLLHRFQTAGDDFTRVSGFGQYNEIIASVYLGIIKTQEDVLNFKTFNKTPYWEAGDLSIKQPNGFGNIEMQIKGNYGYINIPKTIAREGGTTLKYKPDGRLAPGASKVFNLKVIFEEYFRTSVANTRVGVPLYQDATAGIFDFGQDSFLKLVELVPGAFSIVHPPERTALFRESSTKMAKSLLKQYKTKQAQETQNILSKNLGIPLQEAEQKTLKLLVEAIDQKKRDIVLAETTIRFEYSIKRNRLRAIVSTVNPLINTGLGRSDDKTPFYDLLQDLFNASLGSSLRGYLDENYSTFDNKQPEYYYANTYANYNY